MCQRAGREGDIASSVPKHVLTRLYSSHRVVNTTDPPYSPDEFSRIFAALAGETGSEVFCSTFVAAMIMDSVLEKEKNRKKMNEIYELFDYRGRGAICKERLASVLAARLSEADGMIR